MPWGCHQFVIVVFPDHTHYFVLVHGVGFGEGAGVVVYQSDSWSPYKIASV